MLESSKAYSVISLFFPPSLHLASAFSSTPSSKFSVRSNFSHYNKNTSQLPIPDEEFLGTGFRNTETIGNMNLAVAADVVLILYAVRSEVQLVTNTPKSTAVSVRY